MIAVTVDTEFHLLILSVPNEYLVSIRTNSLVHGVSMLSLQAGIKYLSYLHGKRGPMIIQMGGKISVSL